MKKPLITDQLLENSDPSVQGSPPEINDEVIHESLNTSNDDTAENTLPVVEMENDDSTSSMDEVNPPELQKELTPTEIAIQKRTGFWEVNLDKDDAKWIKNACQGKFEFAGPNEAFMLMNCYMGFTGALSRMTMPDVPSSDGVSAPNTKACVLQASAIEACAFFINRYKGSGLEQAQRSFRIAMALNPVIMQMRSLDDQIDSMRKRQSEQSASEQSASEESMPTN